MNGRGHKLYEGDLRTPIGLYAIVDKRRHARWRHFLLIDYPNLQDLHRYWLAIEAGDIPRAGDRYPGAHRVALFCDRRGVALVPGHDVHLVALDLAAEGYLGLAPDDPLAKVGRHHLGVIRIDAQLLGDLFVGEVQPHEVEAQDPDP